MRTHTYPFSAIVGHRRLKLALMLCTIDPKVGGVLLSGARGTAKSTIARALLDLMPSVDDTRNHFVTLPLGASEERITGTLDLEKVLADGGVAFAPGLLHKAHQGILYVDEVNLLADHLVDLLLDVAASGVNTVERDGISHQHLAEFVLIGTMNPEEGELRPQLLDRYGLCVDVNDDYSVPERTQIVRARLAYDAAPTAFIDNFSAQQAQLIARCEAARARLPNVVLNDQLIDEIATRCQREGVEGVRADIVIHRAACAHAALNGRNAVNCDDIDAVAEFALLHRRRPPTERQTPPPQRSQQKSEQGNDPQQNQSSAEPTSGSGDTESDWGPLPAIPMPTGERRRLDIHSRQTPTPGKKKRY